MTFALVLEWLIKAIVLVLVLLGGFAYLTLYERKALARIQMRVGPNRAGPWGILQPIADAVKLIFKEELMPARADKLLFFLAPVVTLVPALVITAVVPWGPDPACVRVYHYPLYRRHQRGRFVHHVGGFDCGLRDRAGGLELQQQVCHDGRLAFHRPDDQLRDRPRPVVRRGDPAGRLSPDDRNRRLRRNPPGSCCSSRSGRSSS